MGAVGASSTDTGTVTLFSGPLSGEQDGFLAGAVLRGAAGGEFFGYGVRAPGDVDGDGVGDVLVVSKFDSTWGSASGAAYLVLGPPSGHVEARDVMAAGIHGPGSNAQLWAAAGAGDVNADGMIDLIVGASNAPGDAPESGAAYVLYGDGV